MFGTSIVGTPVAGGAHRMSLRAHDGWIQARCVVCWGDARLSGRSRRQADADEDAVSRVEWIETR